jgi:general L-amino acid transport system substrate-binding protein
MASLASFVRSVACCLSAGCLVLAAEAAAQTLQAVKQRGTLICGVSQGVLGFSSRSERDEWSGLDVDFCRALAAAIFNDASKVQFEALSATDRFEALQSKKIDVLSRNSTWTLSRETELGLAFVGVNFYDGQGLMVRRARNVTTALDLDGSKVCVQAGTTTELNLRDFFKASGMKYESVAAPGLDDARKAYEDGRCDVLTADASALHGERLKTARADDHDILPELLSKEPLGPMVRQDDFRWFNIVKWTNFAMLDAEELGVSSETLNEALKSEEPDVRRLVGTDGNFGEQLGLSKDWVVRIVGLVGNYVEVYDRNVGSKSRLKIPRGLNALWTNGGILYAPPVR